jgi:hypothetical protein
LALYIIKFLTTAHSEQIHHGTTKESTRAKAYNYVGREKSSFLSFGFKINRENARTKPKTALKPVPVGPLPDSTKFDHGHLPDLPDYHPPLNLRYKPLNR